MAGLTYLADACAIIVFLTSTDLAKDMPQSAVLMQRQEIGVLSVTVWEISKKISQGKLPQMVRLSLLERLRVHGFRPAPFTWEDAAAANTLPAHHRDPMDRMLIAAALRSGSTVITSDAIFATYGVPTAW